MIEKGGYAIDGPFTLVILFEMQEKRRNFGLEFEFIAGRGLSMKTRIKQQSSGLNICKPWELIVKIASTHGVYLSNLPTLWFLILLCFLQDFYQNQWQIQVGTPSARTQSRADPASEALCSNVNIQEGSCQRD